ncbi:MAG: bacillithiol biosynthesis deacetylase BshB1 [Bacteroidetes bacterium RIFCSPLOWO2_12_FULL_35_15]|nr:MAG: bacillithiol biosynthesis deacetylase BshB1 [Bacteroidetes bacterium RIFCSPLOWO2_12_FULL_35_15]
MKLDILAIGVHPDDVELSCSGTLLKHMALGKKCGILDLTQGELGTRGSAELRLKEAAKAAKIIGIEVRENLKMADGFFKNDKEHQLAIIKIIRKYQPEIILCNAVSDRHPDHSRAAQLISEACFYSGLIKVETKIKGAKQNSWRPKAVYHYIQDKQLKPDFVVDISEYIDKKMEAIQAFKSQFFDPDSKEPESPISVKNFLDVVKAKMTVFGRDAGFEFAEGFTVERTIGVNDLFDLK